MVTIDFLQLVLQNVDSVIDGLANAVDFDETRPARSLLPEFVSHFAIVGLAILLGQLLTVRLARASLNFIWLICEVLL